MKYMKNSWLLKLTLHYSMVMFQNTKSNSCFENANPKIFFSTSNWFSRIPFLLTLSDISLHSFIIYIDVGNRYRSRES